MSTRNNLARDIRITTKRQLEKQVLKRKKKPASLLKRRVPGSLENVEYLTTCKRHEYDLRHTIKKRATVIKYELRGIKKKSPKKLTRLLVEQNWENDAPVKRRANIVARRYTKKFLAEYYHDDRA